MASDSRDDGWLGSASCGVSAGVLLLRTLLLGCHLLSANYNCSASLPCSARPISLLFRSPQASQVQWPLQGGFQSCRTRSKREVLILVVSQVVSAMTVLQGCVDWCSQRCLTSKAFIFSCMMTVQSPHELMCPVLKESRKLLDIATVFYAPLRMLCISHYCLDVRACGQVLQQWISIIN